MKKLIAFLLCLIMVLSLVACAPADNADDDKQPADDKTEQNQSADDKKEEDKKDEMATLTVLSSAGIEAYPGFDKFCQETFGIQWETVTRGDGVVDALLSSGELPDMVFFWKEDEMRAAAEGGMLLDLDEYADLLPEVFGADYYQPGMARTRDMFGGLYGLQCGVGNEFGSGNMPRIRWDLYAELGHPEVKTQEDYLNLLKQMVDLADQKDPDTKHYAYGLWTDWDNNLFMRNAQMIASNWGYYDGVSCKLTEQLSDGSMDPKSILDDDSAYKKALQYLFDANQLGLIDPDSKTQNYEGWKTNIDNFKYMTYDNRSMGETYTEAEDGSWQGYAPLWIDEFQLPLYPWNALGAKQWVGISANCENPEKAMAYLNWYYSIDGQRTVYNGPEGEMWTWEGNTRKFTENFTVPNSKGEVPTLADGGIYTFYSFCSYPGLTSAFPDPSGDGYVDAKMNPGIFASTPNKMTQDWQTVYGDYFDMDDYQAKNGNPNFVETSSLFGMVPAASDDIVTLQTRVGDVVMKNSWAMVFAKDQAEFDALWEDMKAEAAELGMEEIVADSVARWGAAKAEADKYGVDY